MLSCRYPHLNIQTMVQTALRLDRLEEALIRLAEEHAKTERAIRELKTEMATFKDEIHRDTKALKLEMAAFKDEMAAFKDEVRRDQRVMNKRWGELANKMGTIVEDIIYPSARRIAREYFGAPEEMEFEAQRILRRRARGDRREFDGVFAWEGHVVLLEAKATVKLEYLMAFDAFVRVGDFFGYFPEYAGRRLIPVFATLSLKQEEVDWLSERRLYALAMGEDAMELLNAEAIDGLATKS